MTFGTRVSAPVTLCGAHGQSAVCVRACACVCVCACITVGSGGTVAACVGMVVVVYYLASVLH